MQIEGKIDHLNHLFDNLNKTWQQRKILYDQSLDLEVGDQWIGLLEPEKTVACLQKCYV